ncbi:type II secretion system F family protein [Auritidibacter ignavus]|uniref:type II secretion system F family protein n=1 Tax=Auritidibacter ignavus TaxID=678932 RepID=UPI00109D6D15|nr:type II secretion system F family protein [Auritidibacter ignavus]
MSVLLGLILGVGLLLIWLSWWVQPVQERRKPSRVSGLEHLVIRSGIERITVPTVVASSAILALVVGLVMIALTRAVPLGICFGLFAALLPFGILKSSARKRQATMREVWPEAVDHLRSAIRAGLTLPEALSQLAIHGPEELRPALEDFTADYRAGMRFSDALTRLKDRLADPVADRLAASLMMTRDVGSADIGAVLETLADFLREEAQTRAELEARQSWTINGARLAVVAPWVVLLLLATQPQALAAYQTMAGMLVLLFGVVVSALCYWLMRRIGALPAERRVL